MFKHILLPLDGSELSEHGVEQTIEMAKALGAHITAMHVVRHYRTQETEGYLMPEVSFLRERFEQEAQASAAEILQQVKDAADKVGIECDTVVTFGGSPYASIVEQAYASHCDLIVMASHCYKGLARLLHGSQTTKVLTHTTVPVLVVH